MLGWIRDDEWRGPWAWVYVFVRGHLQVVNLRLRNHIAAVRRDIIMCVGCAQVQFATRHPPCAGVVWLLLGEAQLVRFAPFGSAACAAIPGPPREIVVQLDH